MIVTIIGYYGHENIGDDLMLDNLVRHFLLQPNINKIIVLTKKKYYKNYSEKVQFIKTGKLGKFRIIKAFLYSKFVIWGGGTCIYESNNNYGLYEILKFQRIAKILRAKFIFAGIGVGKIESNNVIGCVNKIFDRAYALYFRDNESLGIARNICGKFLPGDCGPDLAFLDPPNLFLERKGRIKNISFSGIYSASDSDVKKYAKLLLKLIEKHGATIHFLPAHGGERDDNAFHKKISLFLPPEHNIVYPWRPVDEFFKVISEMDFHIGMRLHSILAADLSGVPNIAISYAPKVEFYIKKMCPDDLQKLRLYKLGETIDVNRIHEVFEKYVPRRTGFDEESKKVKEILNEILGN